MEESPHGFKHLPDFYLNFFSDFAKPEPIIVRLNNAFNLMIQWHRFLHGGFIISEFF